MNPYRQLYDSCTLCPRECRINRNYGEKGFCRMPAGMKIAFAGIHRGEEPPISVTRGRFRGSGTIFFSGCTLRCDFCQNCQISSGGAGSEVSISEFAEICLRLEKAGAANINLVTGSQFIPDIRYGLETAKAAGLQIPIVWNTSSFESADGLSYILPVIDIFLADLKTLDPAYSREFSAIDLYPDAAAAALNIMAQSKQIYFASANDSRLLEGVVLRHLVMPGRMESTRKVLQWFHDNLQNKALLSLMVQFVDVHETNRQQSIAREEYNEVLDLLDTYGIDDGFIQEDEQDDYSNWIPDFTRMNPFPETFCDPVWHYEKGFTARDRS